jgi:hypothetical protein
MERRCVPTATQRGDERDARHQLILLDGQCGFLVREKRLDGRDDGGIGHGPRVALIERDVSGYLGRLHRIGFVAGFVLQNAQRQELVFHALEGRQDGLTINGDILIVVGARVRYGVRLTVESMAMSCSGCL